VGTRQSLFRFRPLFAAAVLLAAVAFVAGPAAGAAEPPRAWAVPSLERVAPDAPAGSRIVIALHAARGEWESFQIIVQAPASGLTQVNVTAPELVSADGSTIGGADIVRYREWFVYLPQGSPDWQGRNRPQGPGWYPDALIPFVDPLTGRDLTGAALDAAPFDAAPLQNQAVWVDVHVPRTAFPGDYTGDFVITSDQGETRVGLHLTVWGFELPLAPYLKSSVGTAGEHLERGEELLRNRLMPRKVDLDDEQRFIESYGLNAANAGFWAEAGGDACAMIPPPTVDEVRAAESRHDPDLFLYAYIADEIGWCTSLYDDIIAWSQVLHQTRIRNLITMAPVAALFDDGLHTGRSAVDVWVMLPKMYDRSADLVAEALEKGDEAWSYNCLVQDDYSPKWEIDFAPINYRIQPGFINQSLGLTGLLYWRADDWSADPWVLPAGYGDCPGEGMLVYPGERVGLPGQVVPSMRLKWLRDGVDDYDYLELLKQAGEGEWALEQARLVGPDWTNWTRDPAVLANVREQLGDKLNGDIGDIDFVDVPADFWAFDYIRACFRHQIILGYDNHTYRPSEPVTRDQMAVYLARAAAGGEAFVPSGPAEATFVDVPPDHWAFRYVEYVWNQRIVTGYPYRHYLPNKQVDRAQMATYVARAVVEPRGDEGLAGYQPPATPTFPDVGVNHWAYRYVEYCAEHGIVLGYDNGTYRPAVILTRDQLAVYLARAFGLM
jgi:hypothetical protein